MSPVWGNKEVVCGEQLYGETKKKWNYIYRCYNCMYPNPKGIFITNELSSDEVSEFIKVSVYVIKSEYFYRQVTKDET